MKLKLTFIAAALVALVLPTQALAAPKSKIKPASASYVVKENGGAATITLTRTKGLTSEASVGYVTSDGTATAPGDYSQSTGRVTFPAVPGATNSSVQEVSFQVPITNDGTEESTESFSVALKSPSRNAVAVNPKITVTIADDDGAASRIEYGLANFRVSEGMGTAQIAVVRSGPTTSPASVTYATSDGTANSSDYTGGTGKLTFEIGEVVKYFNVAIIDDVIQETPEETVGLSLSNLSVGAEFGTNASSVLTIIDDDSAAAVQFSSDSTSQTIAENGDSANLSVVRSGTLTGTVTVDYVTADVTATAGSDYEAAPASPDNELTFEPGEYEQIVSIPVVDDAIDEIDENFRVELRNALHEDVTDASGAALTSTVTIADDDAPVADGSTGGDTTTAVNDTTVNSETSNSTSTTDQAGQILLGTQRAGCGITLKRAQKQNVGRKKGLLVRVRAARACRVTFNAVVKRSGKAAKGSRAFRAQKTRKLVLRLKAGQVKTVKLRFSAKTLKAVRKALRARTKLAATVKATAVDAAKRKQAKSVRFSVRR